MSKLTGLVFIVSVSISLFLPLISCDAEDKENYLPNVPYYYGSFGGYSVPFRPVDKLTYEEASQRDSYYVAYYDEQGKIISFAKYLYGKVEFIDKYFYRPSGILERREGTKSTGETVVQYFDEKGEVIKKDKVLDK